MALLLAASLCAISACAQQNTPEPQAPETTEPEQAKEELVVIGKESDGAIKVEVENATGKEITGLALKVSTDEAYPASMMNSGQKIEVDQKALVCIDPANLTAAQTGSPEDNRGADLVLRTLYNVQITFSGDKVVELHDLNLADLSDIKLCVSADDIAYIEYTNTSGKTENTLESEKAVKAAAEAAAVQAAAEAEAQAAAEAEAQAAAEAEAAAAANNQQYDYSYDSGSSDGSSGSQAEDQCVEDIILR